MKEAMQGAEVAVAIDGATAGRQIEEEDVPLVDVPESGTLGSSSGWT